MKKSILVVFILLFFAPCLYSEDVKITTYYPSPYGSYKHLSVEDGATSSTSYGSLQIVREENNHLGSHLAFIRDMGAFTPKIMGLGYKQSSDTFGLGPGVNSATAFDPTYLAIASTGNVGVGTSAPEQKLAVQGTLGILEGGANPFFHTIFQGSDQNNENVTYSLPPAQGAANTVLTNNGAGALTWSAPAGSTIQFARALRRDNSSPATVPPRPIVIISAPAGTNPFVALDNVGAVAGSAWATATTLDGIGCNTAEGWVITGAWTWGEDSDLASTANGVVTNDYDGGSQEVNIACMRVV